MLILTSEYRYLSLVAANCSNAVLFGFGIVEQCTKRDKIINLLMSETAEAGIDGANLSLLSKLMKLQLPGTSESQQPLSSLIYPTNKFIIQKPLLHFVQASALSSKITVHPDGQITFMGTAIELKDLVSVVAESYLSKNTQKGEKQFMLVPHFNWYKYFDHIDLFKQILIVQSSEGLFYMLTNSLIFYKSDNINFFINYVDLWMSINHSALVRIQHLNNSFTKACLQMICLFSILLGFMYPPDQSLCKSHPCGSIVLLLYLSQEVKN